MYWPPVAGSIAPNSAYASAPKNESTPAATHTAMMTEPEGRLRAIRFGRTKMPEPMTIPMTMAVASSIPSRRGSASAALIGSLAALCFDAPSDTRPFSTAHYNLSRATETSTDPKRQLLCELGGIASRQQPDRRYLEVSHY